MNYIREVGYEWNNTPFCYFKSTFWLIFLSDPMKPEPYPSYLQVFHNKNCCKCGKPSHWPFKKEKDCDHHVSSATFSASDLKFVLMPQKSSWIGFLAAEHNFIAKLYGGQETFYIFKRQNQLLGKYEDLDTVVDLEQGDPGSNSHSAVRHTSRYYGRIKQKSE